MDRLAAPRGGRVDRRKRRGNHHLHAVGAGYAAKLQKEKICTIAYFGDGATNTGAFHESLNLAAVWNLPVLFICENNGYAFSTRQQDHQRVRDVSDRASAYGMPGASADGRALVTRVRHQMTQVVDLYRLG